MANWRAKIRDRFPRIYFFLRESDRSPLRRLLLLSAELKLKQTEADFKDYNAKIRYKMAWDRDPILNILADKLAVREFVKERIGSHYLTEIYFATSDPESIEKGSLPAEFVLKANHGSGGVLVVDRGASADAKIALVRGNSWERFRIRPENLDWDMAIKLMDKWLSQSYYWQIGRDPQWAYRDIPRRVFAEEFLIGEGGGVPDDFRFLMFDGKCQVIHVDSGRFSERSRDFFDPEWNSLPIRQKFNPSVSPRSKPRELQEMLQIAEELSRGRDFLRVDLYLTDKGIKFGELTNYPSGAINRFEPDIWNERIGSSWTPKY